MKAMILAAGLGTRLRPLTNDRPKALVPFLGTPLLEIIIRRMLAAGIDRIVVNIHHFAEQVIAFMESRNYFNGRVVLSDEREQLMDTGGGVLKARPYLEDDQPFLLYNVDVYTNLDIKKLVDYHRKSNALVTLAVTGRPTSRSLLFAQDGALAGWQNNQTGEQIIVREQPGALQAYANSCVHILDQDFFRYNRLEGIVSLTDLYLDLAAGHRINCYVHNEDFWYNLGLVESFMKAEQELNSQSRNTKTL